MFQWASSWRNTFACCTHRYDSRNAIPRHLTKNIFIITLLFFLSTVSMRPRSRTHEIQRSKPLYRNPSHKIFLAYAVQVTRNSAVDLKTVLFIANHVRADPSRVKEIYLRDYAGSQKGLTLPQFNSVSTLLKVSISFSFSFCLSGVSVFGMNFFFLNVPCAYACIAFGMRELRFHVMPMHVDVYDTRV
jgi:hypothetical protein